ncbi:MAG: undecaprenyldiphospho-muramoylpentapeptide beta-N-acetylglucosaminyltransferase [Alphaproteobacteria bacterium]|nr:undecaprenyldiphospho-muramoylpentapeptide beta-N-acetylglucosaminyltransferase [Alphaproteobacteria bacterium]
MRGAEIRPIVIAAGGTGGHFFPAEALATELAQRGQRVALMTDARSGGLASPAFEGRERFVLSGSGIAGRGALRAVKSAVALAAGTWQARAILSRLRPTAIVGFGGYPSVAPVLASRFLTARPAVILHEQNGVLGRANLWLASRADLLALSLPGTTRIPEGTRTEVTGNPVRPAIAALAGAPYTPPTGEIRLLVLGGSLGARIFSDIVPPALALLPAELRARIALTQQCRAEDLERVRAAYEQSGIAATLAPFFPNVAELLRDTHLAIARAGASTVAELATIGRPSILVPLPGAIDGHQRANAAALATPGGAILIDQATLTPAMLAHHLATHLANGETLARAAAAAATAGRPDAAARLADLVETAIARRASKEIPA